MALNWREMEPIVLTVYRLLDQAGRRAIDGDDVYAAVGIDPDQDEARLYDKLGVLDDNDWMRVRRGGGMTVSYIEPTEKGLQYALGWPQREQGHVDALLRLLDDRIASPDTPEEERGRLTRLRDAAAGVTQGVLADVLAAWGRQITGLG
jgi:hypothetical protein